MARSEGTLPPSSPAALALALGCGLLLGQVEEDTRLTAGVGDRGALLDVSSGVSENCSHSREHDPTATSARTHSRRQIDPSFVQRTTPNVPLTPHDRTLQRRTTDQHRTLTVEARQRKSGFTCRSRWT